MDVKEQSTEETMSTPPEASSGKSPTAAATSSESNLPIPELPCYIHAVSPLKKATASNRHYFNLILQTKNDQVRAVCFSPDKQAELKTLEKVKSPVKIEHYNNSQNDIYIHKSTKITTLEPTQIDFPCDEMFDSKGLLPNLASLQKIATEQIVTLKAQVAQLSGIKYLDSHKYGKLKKQEVILRDPSSTTKLILWEDYVNTLEENKTYILENIRVKATKYDRYVNTARGEKFSFKQAEPFTDPLIEVDSNLTTTLKWKCRVLGINQLSNQPTCVSCHKIVKPNQDGMLATCTVCRMTQAISSCNSQWFFKLLVQNVDEPEQKHKLSFFPEHARDLFNKLTIKLDLNTAEETEVQLAILQQNKTLTISFDTVTYRVTEIEEE